MIWLITILLSLVIIELITGYIKHSLSQKILAASLAVLISIFSLVIVIVSPALWSGLVVYLSIFRVVNLFKLIDGRKNIDYLRLSYIRSSISLGIYQLVVVLLVYPARLIYLDYSYGLEALAGLILLGLIVIASSIRRGLEKTRPEVNDIAVEYSKLPTLTVALPARNETDNLEECLTSIVASDYPKMEVLVLDDCSQLKRTPEIIRQFAHDGVVFLEGKEPGDSWTAKNYAYQQLVDEANGEIILFCGVDVRFQPQTIRRMVELKISKKKKMLSFMPLNGLIVGKFKRLLIQPVRYLWELGLPRRFVNRPPVLSSCWLIERSALDSAGSFKAVSRSIEPERYFARRTLGSKDGYSFICLGRQLGLSSDKNFSEQMATATRTRYPILRQRLEHVCALVLVELSLFLLPIGLLIYGLIIVNLPLVVVDIFNVLLASLISYSITSLTYINKQPLSLLSYPIAVIFNVWLLIYSMSKYEFSEVVWKGRNVCIPLMQVRPSLPKISSEQ